MSSVSSELTSETPANASVPLLDTIIESIMPMAMDKSPCRINGAMIFAISMREKSICSLFFMKSLPFRREILDSRAFAVYNEYNTFIWQVLAK